jgi:hypothetical protein
MSEFPQNDGDGERWPSDVRPATTKRRNGGGRDEAERPKLIRLSIEDDSNG